MQTIDEEEIDYKVLDFLKTANKYFDNANIIRSKLPEFEADHKIKGIENLLSNLDGKIMCHFQRLQKEILYMKSNEIQKKSAIFKEIESQIKSLQEHGHDLPEY